MTQAATAPLPSWLTRLPSEEGFFHIGEARRYGFDEAAYDTFHKTDPANLTVGRGLVNMLREHDAPFDGPALELGCGSGQVSLGLAGSGAYPLTVLTDPSPSFLRITRGKLAAHDVPESRYALAVLAGEELDRLPADEFSMIVLRSTLHHVIDVEAFVAAAARALRPGGILTFQEPCMEGFVLMGAMVQFLPELAGAAGQRLTDQQRERVKSFAETMAFYARRDVDKSNSEDKHAFRPDELMAAGQRCGLKVSFLANRAYEVFSDPPEHRRGPDAFTPFFRGYGKHCMGWDDVLIALFDRFIDPYCRLVETASGGGSGPYLHGVFVCRKGEGPR